jgi:hypothetical protein
MSTRTPLARATAVLLILVSAAGLLAACGHGGAVTGAAIGAAVGAAVGSGVDDSYRYDDPYYYYKTGPAEYDAPW